jgi:hypothetical protein
VGISVVKRAIATLLLMALTTPLLAQVPAPAPDLSPLWLAIQGLAARQGATEARMQTLEAQVPPLVNTLPTIYIRLGALDMRVQTLESKPPPGPSPIVAVFSGLWSVLTNPIFLGAVGAFVACNRTGKC